MAARYRVRRDVRFRMIDGQALVLRQASAEVLGLDELGSRILSGLAADRTVAAIEDELIAEHDVEPERLRDDVGAFIAELVALGILEPQAAGEPAPPSAGRTS